MQDVGLRFLQFARTLGDAGFELSAMALELAVELAQMTSVSNNGVNSCFSGGSSKNSVT
jgi:hypothetical protein